MLKVKHGLSTIMNWGLGNITVHADLLRQCCKVSKIVKQMSAG